ncbi:MAG: hypothetical protein HN348_19975 [Proteobacteria bacterium]|nr:hypothetical protein [Pseudomonadota bacterium]
MIWLLLLWACAPEPLASLKASLDRPLDVAEADVVAGDGVFIYIGHDKVDVGTFGAWDWVDQEYLEESRLLETQRVSLIDGAFAEDELRGSMVSSLYDVLYERTDVLKDLGHSIPGHEFHGDLWLFVDRRSRDSTVRQVLYSAGQAQYGNFHLVGVGPRLGVTSEAEPSVVGPPADTSYRPDVLSSLRIGQIGGANTYTIDDRPASIYIDTVVRQSPMLTSEDSPLARLRENTVDPVLYPSYAEAAAVASFPVLPSLEMLLHLSKHLDDQLIAQIELAREEDRAALLGLAIKVAQEQNGSKAEEWLSAAEHLAQGIHDPTTAQFLARPIQSHPIGIYGEDEALGRIFMRDRWLVQDLKRAGDQLQAELTAVLSHSEVAQAVAAEREHRSLWTNPAYKPTLEDDGHFFLSPARSPETAWVDSRGGTWHVANVMDEWVAAIYKGETSIELAADSGWYDRQVWALAPLLTPGDDKLVVGPGYARRLEDAFKAGVSLRRESQVKDLALPAIGAAPVTTLQAYVAPDLRLEPLPMHYDRSAQTYGWLLDNALAHSSLPDQPDWTRRVDEMRALYTDMAAISRADLGLEDGYVRAGQANESGEEESNFLLVKGGGSFFGAKDEAKPEPEPEMNRAASWLQSWRNDPVLGEDVRVMVPAGERADGGVIAWAILGIRPIDLVVRYQDPPDVHSLRPDVAIEPHFVEAKYTVLAPLFVEVDTREVLSRSEFRALADRHRIASELVGALSGMAPANRGCR